MSALDDTTTGQPVNYQIECRHCPVITVIPANKPFDSDDDFCGYCGEPFDSFPEDQL